MSDIPSEIVAEFLSRVPALSLLRFRCVSKTWRSIIDSPAFVKLHLHRTLQTESDWKIVLRGDGLFWADLDQVEKSDRIHYTKLNCPLKSKGGLATNVIGSCHGVVCLGGDSKDKAIALWNPTTREILNLPSSSLPSFECPCRCRLGVGFGYDKVSDDYKVLKIIQHVQCGRSEARVYSMKLKLWRKIDCFPFHLMDNASSGVLASGSLHFKCRSHNSTGVGDESVLVIAAFDLETEEYRLVPPPDFPPENAKFDTEVTALGGCLCTMCYCRESKSIDIWVMKNYPVKASWTKLLTIRQSDPGFAATSNVSGLTPVAYSRSGREVFLARFDMHPLWYDLEKRTIRRADVDYRRPVTFMVPHLCFGSLVKLNSEE